MMEKSDLRVSLKKLTLYLEILLVCFFPFAVGAESTGNFQIPIEYLRGTIIQQTHYPNQYFEINPDTGEAKSFVYLGNEKIAEINEDGEVFYYVNDHLGSPMIVLDESGNIVEEKDYLPYGKINYEDSSINNDYGFSGQELDKETNLNYFEQRYYDSDLGKFISIDPLLLKSPQEVLADPQQLNSYSYGRSNPVRFVDKNGEKVWEYQPYFSKNQSYAYGEPLGSYRGTLIRSAAELTGDWSHPYQCVALAKDFISDQYGTSLGSIGNAVAYGQPSSYQNYNDSHLDKINVFTNGSAVMPQEDDIISWSNSNNIGHVGVIAEVVFDDNSGTGEVYTIEQNIKADRAIFSQGLTRSYNQQGQAVYNISNRLSSYPVQGWARYQNQSIYPGFTPRYTSILHTPATQNYNYYD